MSPELVSLALAGIIPPALLVAVVIYMHRDLKADSRQFKTELVTRLDRFEERLDRRLDKLEARFDRFEAKFEVRIDDLTKSHHVSTRPRFSIGGCIAG